ncbi:MAG: MazG nucleotide pyrophosphohydrolase domain-containing protein [Tumebacillaceae bacterium]
MTLQELQAYIKQFDHKPNRKADYMLKLMEEVGELAEAIRKDKRMEPGGTIKGTVEEELYDVLYYVAALANVYGVDLEEAFHLKEEINREKRGGRKKT